MAIIDIIKVMNYIYEETPPSLFYFFKKIDRIFKLFKNTYGINIYRIGIDQNKEIYIPHIYVLPFSWHVIQ